jgi:hypothetical protein
VSVSVLLSVWLGALFLLTVSVPWLLLWTGPVEPPQIRQDGLSWRMRHVPRGALAGSAWLALASLVSSPLFVVMAIVVALELESWLMLALVAGLPLVGLAAASVWFAALLPRTHSELQASTDRLVWKRRWPLQSHSWVWQELHSVEARDGRLYVETERGESWWLSLPGAEVDELLAVCEVLEATRAKPPPESEPAPEIPRELRRLQRMTE